MNSSSAASPEGLRRVLCDPEQTVELQHPFLAGVVLTLHIYPEMAEAAWHLEGSLLWEGLPCEA